MGNAERYHGTLVARNKVLSRKIAKAEATIESLQEFLEQWHEEQKVLAESLKVHESLVELEKGKPATRRQRKSRVAAEQLHGHGDSYDGME